MLYEKQVVDAVCRYLRARGFRVTRPLSTKAHGEDIKALTPDGKERVTIEAKGATSSDQRSRRYGRSFSSNQVRDHVANVFYTAARHISAGTHTGVAFPKNDQHVRYVDEILPSLKRLKIEVFWVEPDRRVDVVHHWKLKYPSPRND
jgi:hypothetical protein